MVSQNKRQKVDHKVMAIYFGTTIKLETVVAYVPPLFPQNLLQYLRGPNCELWSFELKFLLKCVQKDLILI